MKDINLIPFRKDNYFQSFYIMNNDSVKEIILKNDVFSDNQLNIKVNRLLSDNVLCYDISITAKQNFAPERFGFRLGLDTYMDKYPDWNDRVFPTSLRCEKNCFWGCFVSPLGLKVAVASKDNIVCYKNEYNGNSIAGHRIYTTSVEFINNLKLPSRHSQCKEFKEGMTYCYKIYFAVVEDYTELKSFIKDYAGITLTQLEKYTLEPHEITDGEYKSLGNADYGMHNIDIEGQSAMSYYVRRDWFYYLERANESAKKCQQKAGTHAESWYGYFSRVAYCKITKKESDKAILIKDFENFYKVLATSNKKMLRKGTLIHRLQNSSSMISLLTDFYELTLDKKYLEWANHLADWLMKLQSKDGSYRSGGTHYTCVIYPAKSMLELALAEKSAGLTDRHNVHFDSALRAVQDLAVNLDNIQTEGEMTFEDGMISCEALQLAYMALNVEDERLKEKFTNAAKLIMSKHECLEQTYVPDCRSHGATLRFWEARYDINFFANMMISPHGWTSWKNYATFYLYLLTGESKYLVDTMNTIGACMQCVDDSGELNWGFITDPCVSGLAMVRADNRLGLAIERKTIGEEYLPMVSEWYRQNPKRLIFQYFLSLKGISKWRYDFGGSCDNDVHEHFKCLAETVLDKAFVHETPNKTLSYNCIVKGSNISLTSPYTEQLVYYSESNKIVVLDGKSINLTKGFNFINS